jgi:hypothetical protein
MRRDGFRAVLDEAGIELPSERVEKGDCRLTTATTRPPASSIETRR